MENMNTRPHVTAMIATLAMLFTTWHSGAEESAVPGSMIAIDGTRKACDTYRIDLVVAPSQGRCEGNMVLRYQNQRSNSMAALRLHLDPNMSTRQSLEILSVEDDTGLPLAWNYQPFKFGSLRSDKGAVDVKLPKALAPFGETTVSMKFRSSGNLVVSNMVVLQDDPYQSLDGWYPKAMTACSGGWSLDDDRPADYDVTVQLPSEFCVASTGRVLNEKPREKQRVLHLKAERVRGFTLYAYPHWQRRERRVGQIELAVCLPAEAATWADRMLDSAADAIAFYEKEYAPFPSRHLDIFCPGSLVSGHSKPATKGRMKTSHFEGSIACWAAWAAHGRNERTQCELAAYDINFGGQWLVQPADCA
jgi:hypothetical protein